MKVSRAGVILIKSFEGFRPRAVRREDGRWVIGYGHTRSAREGLQVSESDAELLLQYDLLPVVEALNGEVRAPLNQHQFDALASFAFSLGVDGFRRTDVVSRLNAGEASAAAEAFLAAPEAPGPDARLRRRAAERALFQADPQSPVALAELLAAPLPAPEAQPAPAPEPETQPEPENPPAASGPDPVNARTAAVAALLGEALAAQPTPEPEPVRPETAAPPAESEHAEHAPQGSPLAPQPPEPEPEPEPEPVVTTEPEPPVEPEPAPAMPRPMVLAMQRMSPYPTMTLGPLPGLSPFEPKPAPAEAAPAAETSAPQPVPMQPQPLPEPAAGFAPPPIQWPDRPAPALVLTPPTEADPFPPRPVWTEAERGAPATPGQEPLFEDEGGQPVAIVRAEESARPGTDWTQVGPFLIMGGVGLAACAFSAAAFRLAAEQPSPMGETTVVAWALALIGGVCVTVSAWNLYTRLVKKSV